MIIALRIILLISCCFFFMAGLTASTERRGYMAIVGAAVSAILFLVTMTSFFAEV